MESNKANLNTIEEFAKTEKEFERREQELNDTNLKKDDAYKKLEDLRTSRLEIFIDGFQSISYKLKEIYQVL